MNLANRIKAIRKYKGWTQKEFAKRLGTTQSNTCRYEDPNQPCDFTLTTLRRMADVFDCELVVDFDMKLEPTTNAVEILRRRRYLSMSRTN